MKLITAILDGEAKSEQLASKIAKSYEDCPYIAFMATTGRHIHITYFLPEKQKWWVEYIEKMPQQTLGLETARVAFPQTLHYPKRMNMRVSKMKTEITPCGSNCPKCPGYVRCTGCPCTIHYKEKQE